MTRLQPRSRSADNEAVENLEPDRHHDFLVPKLDKSTSYYGDLGVIATFVFFMYIAGRLS